MLVGPAFFLASSNPGTTPPYCQSDKRSDYAYAAENIERRKKLAEGCVRCNIAVTYGGKRNDAEIISVQPAHFFHQVVNNRSRGKRQDCNGE